MNLRTLITSLAGIAIVLALLATAILRDPQTPAASPSQPTSQPADDAPRFEPFVEEIMATPISVLVPADRGRDAADIVFRVFREVDARMSEWKPTSPLSAVNQHAGGDPVAVPDDLRAVLHRGVEIGKLTDGAFDLTWAALWGLWDFKAIDPKIPDADEIARRVALIDYRALEIDDNAGTVRLPRKGMLLGLGGIAKGYALDRAADELRKAGVNNFLISAGGQVMAGGAKGDRPWRVGIRDPRGAPDDYFAFLEIHDASVSTSGDYERYFILDGVRYHHILDPRTGMPARGVRSVTVLSPDATLADALSTALVILGVDRGLALAERLPNVQAVFVDDAGIVHATTGIADKLHKRHPPIP